MDLFTTILIELVNVIHLFFVIAPILILFISKKKIRKYVKWVLLISILIPLHWVFFKDKCVLTIISESLGGYQNATTNSGFTEMNFKWLYYPLMKVFNWQWNEEGINKIVNLHWIVNIIVLWIYCFYYLVPRKCKKYI